MTKETEELWRRGCFSEESRQSLDPQINIIRSNFVLTLKNVGAPIEMPKARLVAQRHTDAEKRIIIHDSATLKHSSAADHSKLSGNDKRSFNTVTGRKPMYIQSNEPLKRPIYLEPPKVLMLPDDVLWKLIKPLYGICNSFEYWFHTFKRHLIDELQ